MPAKIHHKIYKFSSYVLRLLLGIGSGSKFVCVIGPSGKKALILGPASFGLVANGKGPFSSSFYFSSLHIEDAESGRTGANFLLLPSPVFPLD